MVPRLPKRARGVPFHQRRRVAAFEVSPDVLRREKQHDGAGHQLGTKK
jgi:hypothetical protein